jgi:hypothetical protein
MLDGKAEMLIGTPDLSRRIKAVAAGRRFWRQAVPVVVFRDCRARNCASTATI